MFTLLKLVKIILDTKAQKSAAKILIDKNMTLAVAESCTGGLVSSLMTDVSGSSSFIKANFVTYANQAKTKYLNVQEETLETYGAVSIQTAQEMAEGLLKTEMNGESPDFALVTTGIAGPSGGTLDKPVGLVYIGVGKKDKSENNEKLAAVKVYKYNVNPKYPRILIKYMFAKHAVELLADFLLCNVEGEK